MRNKHDKVINYSALYYNHLRDSKNIAKTRESIYEVLIRASALFCWEIEPVTQFAWN